MCDPATDCLSFRMPNCRNDIPVTIDSLSTANEQNNFCVCHLTLLKLCTKPSYVCILYVCCMYVCVKADVQPYRLNGGWLYTLEVPDPEVYCVTPSPPVCN